MGRENRRRCGPRDTLQVFPDPRGRGPGRIPCPLMGFPAPRRTAPSPKQFASRAPRIDRPSRSPRSALSCFMSHPGPVARVSRPVPSTRPVPRSRLIQSRHFRATSRAVPSGRSAGHPSGRSQGVLRSARWTRRPPTTARWCRPPRHGVATAEGRGVGLCSAPSAPGVKPSAGSDARREGRRRRDPFPRFSPLEGASRRSPSPARRLRLSHPAHLPKLAVSRETASHVVSCHVIRAADRGGRAPDRLAPTSI